ncbi:MAG: AAA family ATPase [Candidatus Pacebacteria bacterium]|nr:AAA family ATPase [Candidatus Paceibacterota bacterium]
MLIGITGSFGAGKGSASDYLVKKKNFIHLSARSLITEEVIKRGLPVNRDSMAIVANDLRKQGGPSYIFEKLVEKAESLGGNVVVESIRAVAEADYIKSRGGLVLGIDAEPEIRYSRIVERASETDNVTFDEWRRQEVNESDTTDPTKQNIFGALQQSDYIILNTTTIEALEAEIDKFLEMKHD